MLSGDLIAIILDYAPQPVRFVCMMKERLGIPRFPISIVDIEGTREKTPCCTVRIPMHIPESGMEGYRLPRPSGRQVDWCDIISVGCTLTDRIYGVCLYDRHSVCPFPISVDVDLRLIASGHVVRYMSIVKRGGEAVVQDLSNLRAITISFNPRSMYDTVDITLPREVTWVGIGRPEEMSEELDGAEPPPGLLILRSEEQLKSVRTGEPVCGAISLKRDQLPCEFSA